MTTPSTVEPLSPESSASLADFARTCKAAARAVSLYPETHPSIQGSLSRVAAAANRLSGGGELVLTVLPDAITVGGRASARPDPAVAELAALMHARLIASLRVEPAATLQDWRGMLLLLARAPEELIAEGGIGKVWAATGRSHFDFHEIDYAEVLREGDGTSGGVDWDAIIAACLHGGGPGDGTDASLLETFSDHRLLGEFLERLQRPGQAGSAGERAGVLLTLLRKVLDLAATGGPRDVDKLLEAMAACTAKMTPEMLMALLEQARADGGMQQAIAAVVSRIEDSTVASLVANTVMSQRGASERLAEAFQVLVPESGSRDRILDLARAEAERQAEPDGGFEDLWRSAADLLTSYSDKTYVSGDYGRELSGARTQAIEVERVSDDPPERLENWLSTVSDSAIRDLDLSLILDLLRIEQRPEAWKTMGTVAVGETRRRLGAGDLDSSQRLVDAVAAVAVTDADDRRGDADAALDAIADTSFARHLAAHLRTLADDAGSEAVTRLCEAVGARLVRPLAEALAAEDHAKTVRRLRELLLGFGEAGHASIEQLRQSTNPAVRRVAVELLRTRGVRDALPELVAMMSDADAHVQREALRAVVQMDTREAHAVVERVLDAGGDGAEAVVQQLIALKEDKAAPLLGRVLLRSEPRGRLVAVHTQVMDALGGLRAHSESARALKTALHRGEWWAPRRTAALRGAAAAALRRIGSPEAQAVLADAAANGSRGVRRIAQAHTDEGQA